MGRLTPGATFTYEREGDTVYAIEEGTNRKSVVGYNFDPNSLKAKLDDGQLWYSIRESAKTNPTLQKILENAILVYQLTKDGNIYK